MQERSHGLNNPLQHIAQNYDNDVIIITVGIIIVTPGKTLKISSIALSR